MSTWKNVNVSIEDTLYKPLTLQKLTQSFEDYQSMMNDTMGWFSGKLDSQNVKRINTNETVVRSKNGETRINGPILEMYDSTPTLRLKQGLDTTTDTFIFTMYDSAGNQTVYLNSSGEAVFAGNIITQKNAYVGNNIYVGTPDAFANKGLYFYDATGSVYTNIGIFLNEYAPGDYGLYISNANDKIEITSGWEVIIGEAGSNVYFAIVPKDGYFVLFTASAEDSHIKHGGSGDLWIQHEGTGVLKIESINNMSIESTAGYVFAEGTWRFENNPYKGAVAAGNKLLTSDEIDTKIATALTGYATESWVATNYVHV